jgi:hypothetical protein
MMSLLLSPPYLSSDILPMISPHVCVAVLELDASLISIAFRGKQHENML